MFQRAQGFFEDKSVLYAVVEQSFIKATEKTNLNFVERFMNSNGFQKIRNNDYFNQELGIILEDLHDENVLTAESYTGSCYLCINLMISTGIFISCGMALPKSALM
jgi:hypothetical protein